MLDKVDWFDKMLWIVSHCKTTGLSYSSWSEIMPTAHIIQQVLFSGGTQDCVGGIHSTTSSKEGPSNQPLIFSFSSYLLPEPSFSLYYNYITPTSGISITALEWCWHTKLVYWLPTAIEEDEMHILTIILFECLRLPNNCSVHTLIFYMSGNIIPIQKG